MTSIVVTAVLTIVAYLAVVRIYRAVRWWTQPAQVEAVEVEPTRPLMSPKQVHVAEVEFGLISPCDGACLYMVCDRPWSRAYQGEQPRSRVERTITLQNARGDVVVNVCDCGECRDEAFDVAAEVLARRGPKPLKIVLNNLGVPRVSALEDHQLRLFIEAARYILGDDDMDGPL